LTMAKGRTQHRCKHQDEENCFHTKCELLNNSPLGHSQNFVLWAVILSLCVPYTYATATLSEWKCPEGQPLSKFPQCVCGEYALIVQEKDVSPYTESGVKLHIRRHGPKSKQQ
jgi:hypothetical protein